MAKVNGCGESASSVALAALLDTGGARADAVTSRFHRTMLWRLRTGRRTPELETAVELCRLSGGAVSVDGWLVRAAPRRARRSPTLRAAS